MGDVTSASRVSGFWGFARSLTPWRTAPVTPQTVPHRTTQKTRGQAGDSEIQAQHDARRGADPNNTPESARVPAATAFWVSSTYFSEGLPYMIVRILSSVYFTDVGAKERFIGYLNFLGIPWNL